VIGIVCRRLESCVSVWNDVKLCEIIYNGVESYVIGCGNEWICVESCVIVWKCIESCGNEWNCVESCVIVCGNEWNCVESCVIVWNNT